MVPPGNSDLIQLLADLKYQTNITIILMSIMLDLQTRSTIGTYQDSSPSWMIQFLRTWRRPSTPSSRGTPACPCSELTHGKYTDHTFFGNLEEYSRSGVPEITEFLNNLPAYSLGQKFLIILRNSLVDNFLRVVDIYSISNCFNLIHFPNLFLAEASENAPDGIRDRIRHH